MPRIRVQASEIVHYDQVFEVTQADWDRLKEANDLDEREEVEWIIDNYLQREEVNATNNFEVKDFRECDFNGSPLVKEEE